MNWYKQLTKNERTLILYGVSVIFLALFWTVVYQPIKSAIRAKTVLQSTLQQQLKQMQASVEVIKQQANNVTQLNRDLNQPFIAWIDGKLLANNLSQFVTRSEPKDAQTLILTFESVIFDDLIAWLQPLEQNNNITIAEADMTLIDRNSGLCNARVTLQER